MTCCCDLSTVPSIASFSSSSYEEKVNKCNEVGDLACKYPASTFQLLARLFGVWDFWDQDTMLYVIHVGPKHGRIWEIKGSANTQSIIGTLNLLDGTSAFRKKGNERIKHGFDRLFKHAFFALCLTNYVYPYSMYM
jgi:hypothetical protein